MPNLDELKTEGWTQAEMDALMAELLSARERDEIAERRGERDTKVSDRVAAIVAGKVAK